MEKNKEKEQKNMGKKKSPHLFKKAFCLGFSFLLLGFAGSASAAFFYFSPAQGNFYQNENFTAGIFVNADVPINAAEGQMTFPTEFLEVISLDYSQTSGSAVNLWVQNPSFSNAGESGNVSFAGVILNPGFTGPAGKILDVVFRVKKAGSVDLGFTDFAILANDGLGTNVSAPGQNAQFTLLPARTVSQEPLQSGITQNKENIKKVEEKVTSLENKINEISEAPTIESRTLLVWNMFPQWLKIGILGLVGMATLILILAILSFGIIVLIWMWSRVWHKRRTIRSFLKHLPGNVQRFFRRIFVTLGWAGEEFEGDVKYGFKLVKRDLKVATNSRSLGRVMDYYWNSILKIIKRFRKRNFPRPGE
jgi:hypothetical protein